MLDAAAAQHKAAADKAAQELAAAVQEATGLRQQVGGDAVEPRGLLT
jgi:hypothetical protein